MKPISLHSACNSYPGISQLELLIHVEHCRCHTPGHLLHLGIAEPSCKTPIEEDNTPGETLSSKLRISQTCGGDGGCRKSKAIPSNGEIASSQVRSHLFGRDHQMPLRSWGFWSMSQGILKPATDQKWLWNEESTFTTSRSTVHTSASTTRVIATSATLAMIATVS